MKVLIACESSGTVREAFRALGHELAFHWSAVQGQRRRLLAMLRGLPQPVGRSADVLFGGVQRVACRSAALWRLAASGS